MFNPPISSGADLFIYVAVILISVGAAIMATDVYKTFPIKKKDVEEKK